MGFTGLRRHKHRRRNRNSYIRGSDDEFLDRILLEITKNSPAIRFLGLDK